LVLVLSSRISKRLLHVEDSTRYETPLVVHAPAPIGLTDSHIGSFGPLPKRLVRYPG
jgi:hypothetical protein